MSLRESRGGSDRTEVRLRGNGLRGTDDDTRAGFLYGGRATIRPIPHFDLYVQYTETLFDGTTDLFGLGVTTSELQAAIDLNLTRHVSVFVGYRWWTYEEKISHRVRTGISTFADRPPGRA